MANSPQKTQFLSQTHALSNHVPSVDLGAFDISVDPKKGRVEILTRVHLETKPTSQLQLAKFEKRFKELVPEVWNKQARFQCTKQGWDDISLALHVKIETTGVTNAHFHIQVQDEDLVQHAQDPYAIVTAKLSTAPGVGQNFVPRVGEFGAAAIDKGEMGSYRANIIYDLSRSPLAVPIKASLAQDAVARQRLEKFGREIMALKVPRKFRSSRRPTLTVNGCGSGNRATLANDAAAFLKQAGVKNPINKLSNGDTTKPDGVLLSFDNAELKNLFPAKPGSSKSLFRQITVAHEFGHMVGLPDEYLCMHALTKDAMENIYAMTDAEVSSFKGGGMQIADVKILPDGTRNVPHIVRHQKRFVKLCQKAGLTPPEFGRMTPSIMSNGMVFHPHHFVTIWEAVCAATGFNDWRIVMS